ncbi:UNVERIFIED_CONTAM: Beta-D-glucosyl crocetin beta-1,6-glucosyltransferase [Sesamum calycinum]|uniref:Beta-D-glucosyl crocetin beta-1,6-glucosyltransferase n=1 Tax=Sesamum calycinum TaxID=2727403 RepID=A0AAW2QKD6_9LAMI
MFPWLAHGHIFPYLELSRRLLIRKNFHIYLCSTPINSTSINTFIHNNNLSESIEVVELHLQPSHELPPHYHTTKNLPSHLAFTLMKAFQTAESSFSDIITTLKPDLVIFDAFQPWAARLASSQGIPAVNFTPLGAATSSYTYHHCLLRHPDGDFPFQELCLADDRLKEGLDGFFQFLYDNVFEEDEDVLLVNYRLSTDIALFKTSRALEGKYIDYFSAVVNRKLLCVGPLVADVKKDDEEEEKYSDIMEWLSKKNQHSTVYISFGSEYFLSKPEIEEIAKGLELCDANFIWVIRFPLGEEISVEDALPKGFLERVKERGIVVPGWAPQARILAHRNTASFVSHCGWSSLNESVYFGVPVIGMPVKLNMFIDCRMLVEAGACVEVERDENGVYKGEEIAKAIRKVVVESSGEGLRQRAQELSEKMKMEEGQELDEVAESLWQLCLKNKD